MATGGGRFAGHALDRAGPQIEIGAAEAGLQFDRALRVGQPVFRHLADGLDHVGDVFGQVAFDLAFLARLHIGGERLAAFLDHAREIAREGLDIDARRAVAGSLAGSLAGSVVGFSIRIASVPSIRSGPDRAPSQGAFRRMVSPEASAVECTLLGPY